MKSITGEFGKSRYFRLFITLCFFCFSSHLTTNGQQDQSNKKDKISKSSQKQKNKKKKTTIKDLTASSIYYDGLFGIYQDSISGKLKLSINGKQLNKEFIYFSQVADGVSEVGTFRGAYKEAKVFKITRYFNRLQFELINTGFYHDPKNKLSLAAKANISNSILASEIIEVYEKDTDTYLIDADKLFLEETLSQIKPAKLPFLQYFTFSLGGLAKSKTRVNAITNYPENTDMLVEYVYSKKSVLNKGGKAITDARNVSLKVWHSFIAMPDNDYEPRFDDPRVGYFTTQVNDMTSTSPTPYRDLIHRWHLKKKYPEAILSVPIEPITWWIENTTPDEFRPIIRKACDKWNDVFRAAGIQRAIVVKEQPVDASWDAGDIRYNVIRWASSPNPRFSGYGPSFVNPKTGQILGADIMLEYATLSQQLSGEKVFEKASIDMHTAPETWTNMDQDHKPNLCSIARFAQLQNQFGIISLEALGSSALDNHKLIEEYLYFLVIHEIGHTLGLNHNMKGSQLHDLSAFESDEIIEKDGLVGSVMDYPALNFSLERERQGQYWPTKPGPYDRWAIQFGYKPFLSAKELTDHLNQSTDPKLAFGNDADDMRWPGKAIDPTVNVGDMSSNAIVYAKNRILLTREVAKELLSKYHESGKSYHEIRNAYLLLTGQQANAAHIISRYVGGIYVDRALIDQAGGKKPFTPVEKEKQLEAMQALKTLVFSPEAFSVPNELYNYLQMQRRGYNHFNHPEDPKIHDRILAIQKSVLKHLLHKNTLQRISDSELYGNEYSLAAFLSDLNDAMFQDDINGQVNSFRQNLQISYLNMLIDISKGKRSDQYSPRIKSLVLDNMFEIQKLTIAKDGDKENRAHKRHLSLLVSNALDSHN